MMKLKQLLKRPSMLFFLLGPILVTLLLGAIVQTQQEELVIPIAIVDHDESSLSQKIIERIKKQERLVIIETTEEAAETMLDKKEIDSVYLFKKDFQRKLLKEKREGVIEVKLSPSSAAYSIVREVIASEVTRVSSSIKAANQVVQIYQSTAKNNLDVKTLWNEAFAYSEAQWNPEPLMTIDYQQVGSEQTRRNEDNNTGFKPFLGLWGLFTMVNSFLLSDWIVKEKKGLFPRIRTSVQGLRGYLLQTSAAMMIFQMLQAICSYLILSHFQFIEGDWILLVMMLLFVYVSFCLTVCFASFFLHNGSYYVFGLLISLILAVFSGSLFPIGELLGEGVKVLSFLPQSLLMHWNDVKKLMNQHLIMLICSLLIWGFSIWRLQLHDKH